MEIYEVIVTPLFLNYYCIKEKNTTFAISFTYFLN